MTTIVKLKPMKAHGTRRTVSPKGVQAVTAFKRAESTNFIYQDDLEEVFALEAEIKSTLEGISLRSRGDYYRVAGSQTLVADAGKDLQQVTAYMEKRSQKMREIEAAIRAGAIVEIGCHHARLVFDRSSGSLRLELE